MTARRFPAPWSVRELEQAFRIEDANGQAVTYTYFRKDESEARQANVLTHDEARRPDHPAGPFLCHGEGAPLVGSRRLVSVMIRDLVMTAVMVALFLALTVRRAN